MKSTKRTQTALFKVICTVLTFHFGNTIVSGQMQFDINAPAIYEKKVFLNAGTSVQFETRNLSTDSDPVMHLISTITGLEVASNDNGAGGFAARSTYVPTSTANYILIVRARQTERRGQADIYKNNVLFESGISFGGYTLRLENLRNSETIQTVKLPRGAAGSHLLYLIKPDGVGIQTRVDNTLREGAAYIKLTSNISSQIIIVGTNGTEGKLRLIRNDAFLAGHDADRDGLGRELEAEIGTCASRSGFAKNFDCSLIADPRDTDGDGISDGWEFLGRNDITPIQPLPKWGANPRHKDLFIEVDFMRRTGTENTQQTSLEMNPASAKKFAAIYGDSNTVSPLLKVYHAAVLQNPDKIPGISTHLDIGVDPIDPADATIYGNWGGFNGVNAALIDGDYVGLKANDAWKTNMKASRLGIFRYALGYSGGGGSCGNSFACAFNFDDQYNPAHEWGHTLGLGHSGPSYVAAADVNCKPNYSSIMNYAFLGRPDVGFSDGIGVPSLNNSALKEWRAVSTSNSVYLDVLERIFGYWVDHTNGSVDWNRNGIFEPEGQTVKAYANYRPGSSCEFTRYNQSKISNATTTTTPVLARLSNRLYIFYTKDGALKYRYSTSSWNCPTPEATGCANGTWSVEKDANMSASVGVDVCKDGSFLRVVSVQFNGKITEKLLRLRNVAGAVFETWSTPTQIPGTAQGEPSLSYALEGTYLVYKGTDLNLHFNLCSSGVWQGDRIAYSATNLPVKSTSQWTFPCIIQAVLPWKPGVKGLFALVPAPDAKLDLWYYNTTSGFWEITNIIEGSRVGPVHSKPSLAFVPYNSNVPDRGRLYMAYVKQSTTSNSAEKVVRLKMSYVKVTTNTDGTLSKEEKIGLDSPFDNVWFYGYGISLFYERGSDTNLRCVVTSAKAEPQFQISFRPKADGIHDFTYVNYNDWDVMRLSLCKRVVSPGGLVSNPIGCLEQ